MNSGNCQKCGAVIPPGVQELCGACLLEMALDTATVALEHSPQATIAVATDLHDFEGFRIIRQLGSGGMGNVYLAEQLEPVRRTVALKVIKVGRETDEFLSRFEAERQALALMDHPSIARVFDAGTSKSGRPYFVMEYIPGVPITQYCDEKNLDTPHRVELFRQVCLAVQHAHQKGMIHRDLKPGNVLIMEQDGVPIPKVIDFGLVKAFGPRLTPDTLLTEHGLVLGTPAYMSPEVAGLHAAELDTRSDVYSLGVMLYELLVGALPFDTKELMKRGLAEILRIIREDDPPRPATRLSSIGGEARTVAQFRNTDVASLRRQISGDLEWIVMRALEKDPRRRYASASEFAADIQNHLLDQPVTARPPQAGYLMAKFLRRHRGPVIAVAAVLITLISGVIASTTMYFRAEQQRVEADRNREIAQSERSAALSEQRKASEQRTLAEENARAADANRTHAERESYKANLSAAELHLRQFEFTEARARLFQAPREARGWEWQYLYARSDNSTKRLFAHSDESEVAVMDLQDAEWSATRRVAFTPDGAEMIFSMDLAVHSFGYPSLEGQRVYAGLGRIVAMSADGSHVFTVSRTGDPVTGSVMEARTGKTLWQATGHKARILTAQFSGDRRRLVTGDRAGTILVWDTASGKQIARTELGGPVRCVAVDASGSRFTAATRSLDVFLHDAETGARRATLSGHTNLCRMAAFSADGKRIVTGSLDSSARVWDANGAPVASVHGHLQTVIAAAFSPDGSLLATGSLDRSVRVWNANTGQELYSLTGMTAYRLEVVAFTPDGQRIVAGATSGELLVWDTEGAATSRLRASQPVVAADLSRDGKAFAVVTGNASGTAVSLWDAHNGRVLAENIARGLYRSVALPPRKTMVAAGAPDGTIQIFDVGRKAETFRLTGHKGLVTALTFSPDGTVLASGGIDKTLRLWNVRTGKQAAQAELHDSVNSVQFSPDGGRLVSSSGIIFRPELNAVATRLWNGRNLAPIAELPFRDGHDKPAAWQATFSPDGKRVAAGEAFGAPRALMWDAASGKLSHELKGHQAGITGIAFSADGTRLFTLSPVDGQLRVWDAASGELRLTMPTPAGVNYRLTPAPQGSSLYAIGAGRPIQIWATESAYHPDVAAALDQLAVPDTLLSDVEERLKSYPGLDPGTRKTALQMMSERNEDGHALFERVVMPNMRPGRSRRELLDDLRVGRNSVRRAPLSNNAWDALAIVNYRLGDFQKAIAALESSRRIAEFDEFEMLLFALAQEKLENAAAAREHFDRAKRLIQSPAVRMVPQLAAMLQEGEALLATGKPPAKRP